MWPMFIVGESEEDGWISWWAESYFGRRGRRGKKQTQKLSPFDMVFIVSHLIGFYLWSFQEFSAQIFRNK